MALPLDLARIRGQREHFARTHPASAIAGEEDEFRVASDVALDFDVEKQDARYRLAGTLRTDLELPCSRCLDSMTWPVNASFDLLYLPSSANTGETENEVESDDLGVAFYEGEVIDLRELVREQLYLTLPMKPLCGPDCQGLCPECGTNLNAGRCDCEHRWVDPRMAALAQLLPEEPPKQ
jgi:uncharacterized protein